MKGKERRSRNLKKDDNVESEQKSETKKAEDNPESEANFRTGQQKNQKKRTTVCVQKVKETGTSVRPASQLAGARIINEASICSKDTLCQLIPYRDTLAPGNLYEMALAEETVIN